MRNQLGKKLEYEREYKLDYLRRGEKFPWGLFNVDIYVGRTLYCAYRGYGYTRTK